VRVYKLAKIFTICVSVQKVPVARLEKPPKTEFTTRKWVFWRRA